MVLRSRQGAIVDNVPVIPIGQRVLDNSLRVGTGARVPTYADGGTNYILNIVNNVVGFYFANNNTVATNRAYLHASYEIPAGTAITINFHY